MNPEFEPKARELLVAFAKQRKPDEMHRAETYFPEHEPDLVPHGHYAVVRVEYVKFDTWVVPELAEAAAMA